MTAKLELSAPTVTVQASLLHEDRTLSDPAGSEDAVRL